MDPHPDPDVMTAILVRGNLQYHSLEADTVVGADRPLILFAEDVIKIVPLPRDKRGPFFKGRLHELGVERGEIHLCQITAGGIVVCDSMKSQLLAKPVLMSLKGPLATASRFRRIGRDHLNPQVLHGTAKLSQLRFADLSPFLGR